MFDANRLLARELLAVSTHSRGHVLMPMFDVCRPAVAEHSASTIEQFLEVGEWTAGSGGRPLFRGHGIAAGIIDVA